MEVISCILKRQSSVEALMHSGACVVRSTMLVASPSHIFGTDGSTFGDVQEGLLLVLGDQILLCDMLRITSLDRPPQSPLLEGGEGGGGPPNVPATAFGLRSLEGHPVLK